jgi:hypothetical protein
VGPAALNAIGMGTIGAWRVATKHSSSKPLTRRPDAAPPRHQREVDDDQSSCEEILALESDGVAGRPDGEGGPVVYLRDNVSDDRLSFCGRIQRIDFDWDNGVECAGHSA